MKIEQIQYILEIYKTGSISKAAQNFYMSRPNLSNSIRNLENEVGFDILERGTDGVTFTKKGEAFVRHGMMIMKEMEHLAEPEEGGSGDHGKPRLKRAFSFERNEGEGLGIPEDQGCSVQRQLV